MPSPVVSESWQSLQGCPSTEDLFGALDGRPCAFLYGQGRFRILAQGPLWTTSQPGLPDFAWERHGDLPPVLPDFLGFLGYELGYALEPLAGLPPPGDFPFPEAHLALYQDLLVIDTQEGRGYRARRTLPGHPMDDAPCGDRGSFQARKTGDSDSEAAYMAKVAAIREEIARGNVYQVNLTRQETWSVRGDLRHFALRLHCLNPAPFSAFVQGPGFTVVSSSPERFLRIQEGLLEARPIKGTAPRGATPAEDARLAQGLLASPKDRSELAMIVDLLRNDLGRACLWPSVEVMAFPELESYANVHHLVATLRGRMRPGLGLRDLLQALFPGGSITGCPKLAAMQLIRRLEARPRRVYCGALGWMRHDLGQADLALPIRTAFASHRQLVFGVGGGVVWNSDPREEYLETIHKGRSLVQCLS